MSAAAKVSDGPGALKALTLPDGTAREHASGLHDAPKATRAGGLTRPPGRSTQVGDGRTRDGSQSLTVTPAYRTKRAAKLLDRRVLSIGSGELSAGSVRW